MTPCVSFFGRVVSDQLRSRTNPLGLREDACRASVAGLCRGASLSCWWWWQLHCGLRPMPLAMRLQDARRRRVELRSYKPDDAVITGGLSDRTTGRSTSDCARTGGRDR